MILEEVVGNVGRRVEMIAEDIEGAGQKGSWGERKRKDLKIVMRGAVPELMRGRGKSSEQMEWGQLRQLGSEKSLNIA